MSNIVQNTSEIRSYNTKKIIKYLRFSDPMTKKDLAYRLDLSFATVSNLCNQLVEDGILAIKSFQNSNGGRIPDLLSAKSTSKGL